MVPLGMRSIIIILLKHKARTVFVHKLHIVLLPRFHVVSSDAIYIYQLPHHIELDSRQIESLGPNVVHGFISPFNQRWTRRILSGG